MGNLEETILDLVERPVRSSTFFARLSMWHLLPALSHGWCENWSVTGL